MQEVQIVAVIPQKKGQVRIQFEDGVEIVLYRSELHRLSKQEIEMLLEEGGQIPIELYQKILKELLGIRVKKRALFLLEKMDRTEYQLCEKLRQSGYPKICIEDAIAYVKKYHYIDDLKYARTYVRYGQEKKSRQRLRIDLMKKGVASDVIEEALEEEFASDEREKIRKLLEKRNYNNECSDRKEQQRTYQFLMRRGYQSGDILSVMRK